MRVCYILIQRYLSYLQMPKLKRIQLECKQDVVFGHIEINLIQNPSWAFFSVRRPQIVAEIAMNKSIKKKERENKLNKMVPSLYRMSLLDTLAIPKMII